MCARTHRAPRARPAGLARAAPRQTCQPAPRRCWRVTRTTPSWAKDVPSHRRSGLPVLRTRRRARRPPAFYRRAASVDAEADSLATHPPGPSAGRPLEPLPGRGRSAWACRRWVRCPPVSVRTARRRSPRRVRDVPNAHHVAHLPPAKPLSRPGRALAPGKCGEQRTSSAAPRFQHPC